MEIRKILVSTIMFILVFCFIAGLMLYLFSPTINSLQECEKRGWDGSEYNTGIREIDIFGDDSGKEIIVKCNKADKETDAMIGVFDALPGIKITEDLE